MESLLFKPHPHQKKIMQSVGGRKKYWANAFFKKKFMANEWVEKKIIPTTNHPTLPFPAPPWSLRSKVVGP